MLTLPILPIRSFNILLLHRLVPRRHAPPRPALLFSEVRNVFPTMTHRNLICNLEICIRPTDIITICMGFRGSQASLARGWHPGAPPTMPHQAIVYTIFYNPLNPRTIHLLKPGTPVLFLRPGGCNSSIYTDSQCEVNYLANETDRGAGHPIVGVL
jgi:hypothetical protein